MLADAGSSLVTAFSNVVIDTTNYGIAISSGHDNSFYNNRIISNGRLPDGSFVPSQNVGAYIWNEHGERGFANNSGHDNSIAWMKFAHRNDAWTPDAASWTHNASLPDATADTRRGGVVSLATAALDPRMLRSVRRSLERPPRTIRVGHDAGVFGALAKHSQHHF